MTYNRSSTSTDVACYVSNLARYVSNLQMRTLIFLIFPLLALSSCISDDDNVETINHVVVGNNVPEFETTELKSPDDFLGRKTLLVLFTTTCDDCRRDMPFAEYAYSRLKSEGLNVVTIGRDETTQTIKDYWNELGLSMPFLPDTNRAIFNLFANQTVPRFYLVDESGTIVWICENDLGYGAYTQQKGDRFCSLIKEKLSIKAILSINR